VRHVSKKCSLAIGVDISSRMIGKAQYWYKQPENVRFFCSDLLNFEWEEQFDIVFSFACLYYVCPISKMKDNIKKWLKPGGLFIAGLDYYQENCKSHHWPSMLNVEMDLKSKEQYKQLFARDFELKDVQQVVLDYPNQQPDEVGSLFTFGFNQPASRTENVLQNQQENTVVFS